jgi:phosphatidate phosphatase APP1
VSGGGDVEQPDAPSRLVRMLQALERAWLDAKRRSGLLAPVEVHAYRGHGTTGALWCRGRVLERTGVVRSRARDTSLHNLRNMARRFIANDIPGARVRARFGTLERELVADEEGYVEACLELPEPLPPRTHWHEVELELLAPMARGQREARAVASVLVPVGARFGVISDLDDTVLESGATDRLRMLRIALLSNAHRRLPFEGVASFYRALQRGRDGQAYNPIFYVSSSPWNLFDLLEDFLDVNGIPRGPLFLRDWSPRGLQRAGEQHKLSAIRSLLDTYPDMPFVLIGDSGERDPEIYQRVVHEHPGRCIAVYIREVTAGRRHAATLAIAEDLRGHGVEMLVGPDTAAAVEHARARGLIAPGADAGPGPDRRRGARRLGVFAAAARALAPDQRRGR